MIELAPYVPEDFDQFWLKTVAEAMAWPIRFTRSWRNDFDLSGFNVETIDFEGLGGEQLHGWLAFPPGAKGLPAFIWIPPYGRESLLPDQYGTREGFVSLSFNFFGHPAFHQEKYIVERGYFSEGAADPHTFVFRRMLQNAVLATRVLQSQTEVDEQRIAAMGMSQGAGMSIWLGAWCDAIKAVCADMPFICNVNQALKTAHRYPLKELTDFMATIPLGEQRVLNTISYFDTVNQATRCKVPTHVSLGLKDPACRPENVRSCYSALPGAKELQVYDWGHDWHADMVEKNRNWLMRHI